jgi:prepilin-type N-terminal cleavage/methylation domain-containing protein
MRSEKGFSFIEVMIGMAVLGILAIAFQLAIQNGVIASNQANVRTTAEKLAVSQMEAIKSGPYQIASGGLADYTSVVPAPPSGYRIKTLDNSSAVVADYIYGIPVNLAGDGQWTVSVSGDPGIQKVTIIVESNADLHSHGEYKEIFRLTDFKVNR